MCIACTEESVDFVASGNVRPERNPKRCVMRTVLLVHSMLIGISSRRRFIRLRDRLCADSWVLDRPQGSRLQPRATEQARCHNRP